MNFANYFLEITRMDNIPTYKSGTPGIFMKNVLDKISLVHK